MRKKKKKKKEKKEIEADVEAEKELKEEEEKEVIEGEEEFIMNALKSSMMFEKEKEKEKEKERHQKQESNGIQTKKNSRTRRKLFTCRYGAKCHMLNPKHYEKYYHPEGQSLYAFNYHNAKLFSQKNSK